jgi:uncharacterized membrane protein YebE (DUF533 family)
MNLNKIVQGLVGSGVVSGLASGVAGGAVAGALLSKKGHKHAGTLLKVGGLAGVGGLAWKAYRGFQESKSVTYSDDDPTSDGPEEQRAHLTASSGFDPAQDSRGLLLVRAMISAAMADGHISAEELTRITRRLAELDLRDHEKSLILDELRCPVRAEQLVEQCTDPTISLEVYAASLLAIDTSCPAGRVYLEDLAEQLALPPALIRNVREQALPVVQHVGQDTGQDRAA